MKWNEFNYSTVSKRAVLWARSCGGLWHLDLCRPDPPNPSPPTNSSFHLLLFFSRYLLLVVDVVSQMSLFSSGRCYLLLFSLFVFCVGWWCSCRLLTWVWAILVRGRGLPWRLFVLVLGVTYMLCSLVGFPRRILVELSLLMFECGSCPFFLLQWEWSVPRVFFSVVSNCGLVEWFVYAVYVGDGVQSVVVGGVLTLYEL